MSRLPNIASGLWAKLGLQSSLIIEQPSLIFKVGGTAGTRWNQHGFVRNRIVLVCEHGPGHFWLGLVRVGGRLLDGASGGPGRPPGGPRRVLGDLPGASGAPRARLSGKVFWGRAPMISGHILERVPGLHNSLGCIKGYFYLLS